jgi:hypothetical protein
MKKRLFPIFSSLFILVILGLIYFTMMPHWTSDEAVPPAEFSTKRALNQVEAISKPHYVGSQEHEVVANYLIKELNKLGLRLQFSKGIR